MRWIVIGGFVLLALLAAAAAGGAPRSDDPILPPGALAPNCVRIFDARFCGPPGHPAPAHVCLPVYMVPPLMQRGDIPPDALLCGFVFRPKTES